MSDLSFHIKAFVPSATGEELEHREAILNARDHASALRSRVADDFAFDLACAAHDIAGAVCFAEGVSTERLKTFAAYVRALTHASFLAEQLAGELYD